MLGGYMGKILRIDLTKERITEENLLDVFPEPTLQKYVGCFGLGLKLLYDRLPLGIHPADPHNILIFMTGPLTGIPEVPCSSNTTLVTLNADTGYTAGRSHSHGFWASNLKHAGYDGVIIEGASERPVYLWINDAGCEIRDACKLLGKDTHSTEDLIKQEVGESKASVASIGPAGENMSTGALIENDKHHTFAHSGSGMIMGSKKLKAIAVHGTGKVSVVDQTKLKEITKRWRANIFKSPLAGWLTKGGITRDEYRTLKDFSAVSAKNFLETNPADFGIGMSKHKVTPRACFACPIACAYEVEILSGHHKGYTATLSGGGEALEAAASLSGVYDSRSAFYLADICDRMGFNASTIGSTIALAIECYQKGLITDEDTGGLELDWGDERMVERMINMAARKEGKLGELLALGPKKAAYFIGGEAVGFAVHVKGAAINLHDWRAAWGILLGQIVGGGAGWPSQGADQIPQPEVGFPNVQDPLDPKGKPEAVARTWPKKYWEDCQGTCDFATLGVPTSLVFSAEAFSAVTGWKFTAEGALTVGERVLNLERAFNVRRGLTPADDWEVSRRLVEAPSAGRAKGKSIAPYLRGMVMRTYEILGWDEKTGKPWRKTLTRLGLEEVISDLWE